MEKEVLEACPKCGASGVLYCEGNAYFVKCAECGHRSMSSVYIEDAVYIWNWEVKEDSK